MRSDGEHNLLFLLGLTMLGCPTEDDPPDDDGAGTSNATNAMTEAGSMSGAMSTSTQGTTSMEATTAQETSAGGSGTGATDCTEIEAPQVGPISQVCLDQVALAEECYGALPEGCAEVYAAYCQYTLEYFEQMYGAGCVAAYEALLACLNAVDCAEIDDENICMAENAAAEKQCA